jgi:hypothetical protein
MAVVRCSRGGKTRTLLEIAHMMRKDEDLAVLFVSFNDFMPLTDQEIREEPMLQVFLKRVAFTITYKFEQTFNKRPDVDARMAFESFRASNVHYDPCILSSGLVKTTFC